MYMFINVYVYVSIVYMVCSPVLEEIKNLSIYLFSNNPQVLNICNDSLVQITP